MKKLKLFASLALLAGLAACGANEEPASPLPDAGCQGAGCSLPDASDLADASVAPLPDAGRPDAGELPETDAGLVEDAGLGEDAGQLEDGGTADAGPEEPAGAIPGYLACDDDSECPVGYGNCISAIPLNRRDSAGT
ncbi:MAG TPA: hypothetical protein DFS52_18865, partial [Myxococcales bacterium]|nr:hypothetical protein [Myxococcales bacterium]